MDGQQFDQLSRLLGNGSTRRGLLGVAAAMTGLSLTETEARKQRKRRRKKKKKDDDPGAGNPPTNYCCQFYCYNTGETKYVCLADVTSCDCRCAQAPDGCSASFQGASQVASCDLCGAA